MCSFQAPVEIAGVSNIDFLRVATNARRKAKGDKELDPLEFYAHVMPKVWCACAPWPRISSQADVRAVCIPRAQTTCCC